MDAAYDAQDIRDYIEGKGRVPIIDGNKRRSEGLVRSMPRRKRGSKSVQPLNGPILT
jgi:hypothetical protein